ncbi:MAG: flavin reductase, partial [Clostridia bacterium]
KLPSTKVAAPLIDESPISLECKVKQVIDLGSHDMFLAEIVAVDLDEELLDDKEKLHISRANLVTYAHGEYFSIGKKIGKFGFSVKKPDKKKKYQKR